MQSISCIISDLAKSSPQAIAITCECEHTTWNELEKSSNQLARAYQQLGVKKDDLVTIALPNSIEFYQACIAVWKLGATPQPVSCRLPAKELQAIVELAKPALIHGFNAIDYSASLCLPVGFQFDEALSSATLPTVVSTAWKVMTSGGSTGCPKLIVSHVPSEYDSTLPSHFKQELNLTQLVLGPLYHNAPFTYSMEGLFRGHHLIVMKKFDAAECLSLLTKYKVEWTYLVPTMMQRIWKLGDEIKKQADLSALKTLLHTAGPCPAWLQEEWINWIGGEHLHEIYGGTEATGGTWITGTQWLSHRGSVGQVMEGCNIKVVDDKGQALPPGAMGEIYFLPDAGQGSTYHYIGAEPESIEGGWETLGDMGYLDDEGYLYLGDRKKDLIISGGANIYPAEVEAAIDSHPAVLSCAVTGVPHEDLGQAVHGVVESDGMLTQDALLEYLKEHLVRYKIPRSIAFVDQPVRSDAGKVRRSELVSGASV